MPTEYDNIDVIGTTHEISSFDVDKIMNSYYHNREVSVVSELLSKLRLNNFNNLVDLGCSIGTWYNDFKIFGFEKITGIDISKERGLKAKKRGYDEIHICNAYELPFDDESQNCVISNDVFIHVLQDDDKLKILKEVYRVLKKNGIFIFNFANSKGFGYNTNQTVDYCRFCTLDSMKNLINQSEFKVESILPSYYTIPRIGAHPSFVTLSSKVIFPTIDKILKKSNNLTNAKVIYFGLRK